MAFFVFKRKFKCNLKNVDKEYVFMLMNKPPVIFLAGDNFFKI